MASERDAGATSSAGESLCLSPEISRCKLLELSRDASRNLTCSTVVWKLNFLILRRAIVAIASVFILAFVTSMSRYSLVIAFGCGFVIWVFFL